MIDETEAKFYKAAKILLIAVSLLLVCNGIWCWWQGRSSTTADNNVTRTVEQLKARNESARSEVESGRREIEAAEGHIERAADAVGRSTEAAQANARSTDELQSLISECQGIVKAQRELIQEIDRANGIAEEEGPQG